MKHVCLFCAQVEETSEPEAPRGFCQLSQEQRWEVQRPRVAEPGISPTKVVIDPTNNGDVV